MLKNVKFGLVLAAVVVGAALSMAQGGGGGGRQRGGQRGNQFGIATLLGRADVQKELNVTEDQKTKLADLRTKMQEEARAARQNGGGGGGAAGGGNFDPEAMRKRMAEQEAKTRTAFGEILDEKQMKRLDEISIQLRGNAAITDEKVQKALGLSEDQLAKIKELNAKAQEANRSLQQKTRDQEITREEAMAARTKNQKALNEELGKVLTAEQAAKLKDLGGKKFVEEKIEN